MVEKIKELLKVGSETVSEEKANRICEFLSEMIQEEKDETTQAIVLGTIADYVSDLDSVVNLNRVLAYYDILISGYSLMNDYPNKKEACVRKCDFYDRNYGPAPSKEMRETYCVLCDLSESEKDVDSLIYALKKLILLEEKRVINYLRFCRYCEKLSQIYLERNAFDEASNLVCLELSALCSTLRRYGVNVNAQRFYRAVTSTVQRVIDACGEQLECDREKHIKKQYGEFCTMLRKYDAELEERRLKRRKQRKRELDFLT